MVHTGPWHLAGQLPGQLPEILRKPEAPSPKLRKPQAASFKLDNRSGLCYRIFKEKE